MNVFISYAQEDTKHTSAISQLLTSWNVISWAPPRANMNQQLSAQIQQALTQSDIFLRVCTSATLRSYWMNFEQTAFLSLQSDEYRRSQRIAKKLINIIFDKDYHRLPFDYADPTIDASDPNSDVWQETLHAMLFDSTLA